MLSKYICVLFILLLVGCSHSVHLVNVGDFSTNEKITSGKTVESIAEQFVIMGITTQTDYVNEAREELIKRCPNGTLQAPVTRISTSHGFFSWTNKAHMQALCIAN